MTNARWEKIHKMPPCLLLFRTSQPFRPAMSQEETDKPNAPLGDGPAELVAIEPRRPQRSHWGLHAPAKCDMSAKQSVGPWAYNTPAARCRCTLDGANEEGVLAPMHDATHGGGVRAYGPPPTRARAAPVCLWPNLNRPLIARREAASLTLKSVRTCRRRHRTRQPTRSAVCRRSTARTARSPDLPFSEARISPRLSPKETRTRP